MAKQIINVGTAPDNGTGDTLRVAFTKARDNFTELYDLADTIPVDLGELTDTQGLLSSVNALINMTDLIDVGTAELTVDKIYTSAVTTLEVYNVDSTAYVFDQYLGNNPTVYAINGTTIAFDLNVMGHPFLIQTNSGIDFNDGLVHVAVNGVVKVGAAAQGQVSGTLYWKIPDNISGNYLYRCMLHSSMLGVITIVEASKVGGEGLRSRSMLTGSTGDILASTTANIDLLGYKGYLLYKVQTSAAAWVRLYVNAAARTADANRPQGQDPLPGAGVIAEVITAGADTVIVAPGVVGFNDEPTATNVIPVAVSNLDSGGATVDITVTLTAVELEV